MNGIATPISRRTLLASAGALAAVNAVGTAQAQSWPQKPVRLLVGFAAGGNIDNVARLTAQRLSETFGQQFLVENRIGAMGTLAADAVVKAAPDGYTLFWAGTGTVSIFPAMGKPPYDIFKDLAPISMIGTNPQVLIVNPKLPIKNVKEFVDYVKGAEREAAVRRRRRARQRQQPVDGPVPQARGTGNDGRELSRHGAGDDRRDCGPHPDHVCAAAGSKATGRGRKVRMIAISDDKRSRSAPEIPTIAESGYPGFRGISWNGLMAPAATPKDIINRIAAEFAKAAKDPKFIAALDKYGVDPAGIDAGRVHELHQARHGAVGGSGKDRRRQAAVAAVGSIQIETISGGVSRANRQSG